MFVPNFILNRKSNLIYLLSLGIKAESPLIFDKQSYDITFPCEEDLVCFNIRHLRTSQISDYIAVVTNGKIQVAESEEENSKCTLQLEDNTYLDSEHHSCQKSPEVFPPHNGEYIEN